MDLAVVLSFLLFLGFFTAVGLASVRVKQDTTDDYLIAGRGMHPALAALSAVSTWNSGYMFIGFIGFTYMVGYSVIWLGIVSTVGQVLAWVWLYKFIQEEGQERGVRSLSSLVAEKAGAPEAKLAAALSVLFLGIYAAAQLTSGGKALFVMMGWPEIVGILIGFILVVAYCYAGGIRASIWTDAAQSCVMVLGSTILCWIAIKEVGGLSGLDAGLEAQSPTLTNLYPSGLRFGISMWVFAFFLGGLGVAGQPQVVSRVMTLGSDSDRKQAMVWFFVWQTPFIVLMLLIGFASRVLFNAEGFDAELGLPTLAMETMPAIGVGMILASIFAATMSTADSQVLACTAAITDDIKPEWRENHKTTKIVTLVVAIFATMISIGGLYVPGGDSVFALVILAVYGLGGIFIPLLTIRWMGYRPDSIHSIAMMIAAFAGVISWTLLGFGGSDGIFPSVPGMGAAFATHFVLNQIRTPEMSPIGRFCLPGRKKASAVAAAIIIPFGVFEVAYFVGSPDRDASESDEVGDWIVEATFGSIRFFDGIEYIDDGDTEMFVLPRDSLGDINGQNIVGIRVVLTYSEDETSSGIGCNVPGASEPESDLISGTITIQPNDVGERSNHSSAQNSGSGTSSHILEVKWYNDSMIGNVDGVSKSSIEHGLSGLGTGYFISNPGSTHDPQLTLGVQAEAGGSVGCSHTDDGEEIEYLAEVITLDYTIKSTSA
ncbi:MAG: hypothetical protein CMB77_01800 [Euryarchaeota archaeon]|nr:hypothetical protein [Euryarchaeota archaeon]